MSSRAGWVRKLKWWVIGLAFLLTFVSAGVGVAFLVNPPVEYYGVLMWKSELFAQNRTFTCITKPLPGMYEYAARFLPVPPMFICFDTDAEARAWAMGFLRR